MATHEDEVKVFKATDGRLFTSDSVEAIRQAIGGSLSHKMSRGSHTYEIRRSSFDLNLTHYTEKAGVFANSSALDLRMFLAHGVDQIGIDDVVRVSVGQRSVDFIALGGRFGRLFRINSYGNFSDVPLSPKDQDLLT